MSDTSKEAVPTEDGSYTMRHPEHGETYHSVAGAEAEALDLYVGASGFVGALRTRRDPVRVLDVGLGLAYNAVATIEAWLAAKDPPDLAVTSLEIDDGLVKALAAGNGAWQANWSASRLALCTGLRCTEDGWYAEISHPTSEARATWRIDVGDATASPLPSLPGGPYTFIWQDPFSPAKNPSLWTAEWFSRLRAQASPECRLMTYSVARAVRDALATGGWTWAKIPCPHAGKRHWLTARVSPAPLPERTSP